MDRMRLAFLGTPDFAVPSLQALCQEQDFQVAGVVTQPDRPGGRGNRIKVPPVKKAAVEEGLSVFQPEDINSVSMIQEFKKMEPQVLVVVAFGQLLKEELLSLPAYGCINLHASLLPALRGAAPIQWAIIHGLVETGLTTIRLDEGMDTGDILLQEQVPIGSHETAGELHNRMSYLGAGLLLQTLSALKEGVLIPVPQGEKGVSFAPRLTPRDSRIHWCKGAEEIHNLIRGSNPSPGAYTYHRCGRVKIWRSHPLPQRDDSPPGTILWVEGEDLLCNTGEGILALELLQPAGKRQMKGRDYFHGYCFPDADSWSQVLSTG